MNRRWRVVYQGSNGNRASVLMSLRDAWGYLNIFNDALRITDGSIEFDRENPPGLLSWFLDSLGF